jgi:hypothetical protein
MPYEKYSGMAEDDLKALVAYLRTLKPVKKPTPELKSSVPLRKTRSRLPITSNHCRRLRVKSIDSVNIGCSPLRSRPRQSTASVRHVRSFLAEIIVPAMMHCLCSGSQVD